MPVAHEKPSFSADAVRNGNPQLFSLPVSWRVRDVPSLLTPPTSVSELVFELASNKMTPHDDQLEIDQRHGACLRLHD